MFDMKGITAVITGGAKGIGAATVRNFVAEGAKFVAIIDVDEASGTSLEHDLQKEYSEDVVKFFKSDVTNDKELFNVFDYVVEHHGYLDVVVNNAGVADDRNYKKEIEINFTAVVTGSFKAIEMMRKDQGGHGGTIINISSISALCLLKGPTAYVYAGTKSAIFLFSNNLGNEQYYSHTGVRVITLCFGLTTTDIIKNLKGIDDVSNAGLKEIVEASNSQSPEAAAAGVIEAFKNGKSGSTWLVLDGETKDITNRVIKAFQIMSGEIEV